MADGGKENIENFVVVINCSKCFSSQEFIKQIIKDNFTTQKLSDGLSFHPWRIENKYYCADVKFLVVPSQDERPAWLNNKEFEITAGVILFDQIQSSFETAKEWVNYVTSHDAEVVLLVGSTYQQSITNDEKKQDSSSLTSDVLEFSIKNSLEFIDLNEEIDPEDDFPDTVGFARVNQALQAIEWPDLQMKGEVTTGSKSDATSNEKTKATSENKTADVDVSQTESVESLHHLFDGIVEETDLDGEEPSFDKLFQQMQIMKEKAENLPHTERKAYAEQVAVAFWKAIGGDEDEIEDLDLK